MAGIHSGDSACVIPPYSLSEGIVNTLQGIATKLALRLGVKGLLNIQFAIKDQVVYVIEANPRASRTVPFVSKATGVPLAKAAARIMAGEKLARLGLPAHKTDPDYYCVKEAVMPWGRFPGARVILGPEMKSTGEVMGIAPTVPAAYAKTQFAIDYAMPEGGLAFVSVNDGDKRAIVSLIRDVERMGFGIVATQGTAKVLRASGIDCLEVSKIHEADAADGKGERPSALDLIRDGKISLIINTPFGTATRSDGYEIRSAAVRHGICHTTTLAGAQAMIAGMEAARQGTVGVIALQDL